MKPILQLLLVVILSFGFLSTAQASKRLTTIEELKKEIAALLKHKNLDFLEKDTQEVGVDFLINARNEVVVLDVYGDSVPACEYVKEELNFKRVKFKQTNQLTRYVIRFKLVKNET